MGKIDFPKITRPLDLGDYQPEFAGQVLYVWVNPPLAKIYEHDDRADAVNAALAKLVDAEGDQIVKYTDVLEKANNDFYSWWADLLSQGADEETHFSGDDMKEIAEASLENDPGLWQFIQAACLGKIGEYRQTRKKD